jgi:eukaryotic-like serine/threonine-protein kinase
MSTTNSPAMNHSTETLLRIERIFTEALSTSEGERAALIEARCNRDAELIAEVQSLLRACAAEEHSTASLKSGRRNGKENLFDRKRLGPYEIDRLLGRGGMGAVYLAHRADGQFERQVAIKLIDLPLATDLFRERFRQERQILAGLQHPYIARLLDGGVTSEGEPYLAMEYVEGIPIDRFCANKTLTAKQRLKLFENVCEAVQYAHQNLVVHRDLKPDNILVVEDGTPRLLDFGTAKLISPSQSPAEGEFTRHGYQSFTPQYASPEQVLGNPITTASDTYSLGVLLYLLLTGSLPYELKEFTTAEMVRVICEEPPRKPIAADSSVRTLDPDLEAILLKALRKEPGERYLTAAQLGGDVCAYLAGQPVTARRGTFRYRAGKFIRRNRVPLGAAGLLAVTLVAGAAGVLWQSRIANIERKKVEARSADLRQLSNSLLSELDEALKQIPGSTGAQKLLVDRVLEHLDRMAQDAQGDRQTQLDLADAYTRLGNIQGNDYEQNLGNHSGALVSIGKAIDIAQKLVAANLKDQQALRALATAQAARGDILSQSLDVPGSVEYLQAAANTYDQLIALPGVSPVVFLEAGTVNSTLGDALGQDTGLADISAAHSHYQKSLDLDERAAAIDPNFLRAKRGIATMQMKIGNAELDIDPAQALKDFQLALKSFDALPTSEQQSVSTMRLRGITIRKIGTALSELGEYAQALPYFQEALKIHQRLADADPKDVRNLGDVKRALQSLAEMYEYAADPALAAPGSDHHRSLIDAGNALQEYAATIEKILKQNPGDSDRKAELANVTIRVEVIQRQLNRKSDPQKIAGALNLLRNAAADKNVSPMILDLVVSSFLRVEPASLRDPSLRDARFSLSCAERGVALTHRKTPAWLLSLAQAYRATNQTEKTRTAANEGLALLPAWQPGTPKSRIRKLLESEAASSQPPDASRARHERLRVQSSP